MTQPPNSGAPLPVQGVTGGPGINQGTASINPGNGNLTLTPPGNAVEIKKAPSALNVFEYFNSNADQSHISLAAQVGGPYQLAVVSSPTSVVRGIDIIANGSLTVRTNLVMAAGFSIQLTGAANIGFNGGTSYINGDSTHLYLVPPASGGGVIMTNVPPFAAGMVYLVYNPASGIIGRSSIGPAS